MVRLRRPGSGSANGLAALIPAELFNPSVSNQGGSPDTYSKMATRGGHVIAEAGAPPDPARDTDDRIIGSRQSSRYALGCLRFAAAGQVWR